MQLSGNFDPEALTEMQTAFDEAWRKVPAEQRTVNTKDALARSILHHAARGAQDPVQLSRTAFSEVIEASNGSLRLPSTER